MDTTETVRMNLNIGDQRIFLNVGRDKQDEVRRIERRLDDLYRKWRRAFPARTDREVLAMMAYQYAAFYEDLARRHRQAEALASECLAEASAALESPAPATSDTTSPQGFMVGADGVPDDGTLQSEQQNNRYKP